MKIPSQFKQLRNLIDAKSPQILTGMAVAGTFLSVYFTYKGTQKATLAIKDVEDQQFVSDPDLTNQQKFLLTYKFYAPAAASVVGTSACMIMATKIGLNRTAALTGALIIADRANGEYADKVKELFGENKHIKVTDAVAKDQVEALPALGAPREGEQWFIDAWTSRKISATMPKVERAVNEFNKNLLYNGYASLNEFYLQLDMEQIQPGNDLGWNIGDGGDRFVELGYTTVLKDDQAVVIFKFDRLPMPGFHNADVTT